MTSRSARIGGLLGLALAIGSVVTAADPAPTSSSSTTPTYITVGDIVREVVSSDANSITLRETYFVQPARPVRGRPANPNANKNTGWQHRDTTMNFTADATARIKRLPPKVGADGKKEGYNPEEFAKLKGNPNLPGFKAELSDLKPGQMVEVHIVRLAGAAKTKDASDGQLVRWALIIGEKDPKATPTTPTKNPKSNNN